MTKSDKKGVYRVHSGTFRGHSGNIQRTFGEHSGSIQGTFRGHSGNIQRTFREHAQLRCLTVKDLRLEGKHSGEHSGNIQGTFRGTFREHSRNIRGTRPAPRGHGRRSSAGREIGGGEDQGRGGEGHLQGRCREPSENLWGTFREHIGNLRGT